MYDISWNNFQNAILDFLRTKRGGTERMSSGTRQRSSWDKNWCRVTLDIGVQRVKLSTWYALYPCCFTNFTLPWISGKISNSNRTMGWLATNTQAIRACSEQFQRHLSRMSCPWLDTDYEDTGHSDGFFKKNNSVMNLIQWHRAVLNWLLDASNNNFVYPTLST